MATPLITRGRPQSFGYSWHNPTWFDERGLPHTLADCRRALAQLETRRAEVLAVLDQEIADQRALVGELARMAASGE